jgi:hypothetical protein
MMLDHNTLDLTFPGTAFGTHETPWDLKVYLYRGGASIRINQALAAIEEGRVGRLQEERLPLVNAIHGVLLAKLAGGTRKASVKQTLFAFKKFFTWADQNGQSLTLEDATMTFRAWVEDLIHQYRIQKKIKHTTAHSQAGHVAELLARALSEQPVVGKPGASLLALTRMRNPKIRKSVISARADKQNLEQAFAFGHLLADLCDGLDLVTIRGPTPITLTLRDGRTILRKCELKRAHKTLEEIRGDKGHREAAARSRAALALGESTIAPTRRPLLNLRIEAELLIFCAQTGMNLAQAFSLHREAYRWRTEGDDVEVFHVYKSRRGGEAVFRAFKEYRQHLKRYLAWLEQTGLSAIDDRLFPQSESKRRVKAADTLPGFRTTRTACKELGIAFVGPRELRKTRVNWLMRRSRDLDLTADMSAHTKETLIRHYERPHHQAAVSEITRFHLTNDPTFQPPGPGLCVENTRQPKPIADCPTEAPQPDCANPDGCLFCFYQRDEMSLDYCWSLASARHLKALEVALWRSPKKEPAHPANRVIDRINAKMHAISGLGQIQAEWVHEAEDRVRTGTFHPMFCALIELGEILV